MANGKYNLNASEEEPWTVNLWGSHPDLGNDDCLTGLSFSTQAEARACIANIWSHFDQSYSTAYFELDGPDLTEVELFKNPLHDAAKVKREQERYDQECRQEHAMQAGMSLGVEAYNEAMGYD